MENNTQMWNKSEEREISIGDLLWKLVYGWRLIIVWAVVLAVCLGGLKYVKDVRATKALSQVEIISIEEKEENLSEEEKKALEDARAVQNSIAEKQDYQSRSALMRINPYAKPVVTLQYYVDTHYIMNYTQDIELDYSAEIVAAYTSYVENKGLLSNVSDTLKWEMADPYLAELISVGRRVSNDSDVSDTTNGSGNTFVVYLTGEDEEQLKELTSAVEVAIEDYKPTLEQKIGTHDLVLVSSLTSTVVDATLMNTQTALADSITTLQTKLDTMTAAFSAAQKQILEGEKEVEEESEPEERVSLGASISVKYIILGAFVGIFLACVWIALRYILSNKLKGISEFEELYGLRIFGELEDKEGKKKRFLAVVDRCLDKLRKKEQWTLEEQKELILTNLTVSCKKEAISKLFVTSSLHLTEAEKQLLETVTKELKAAGVQVVFGENIIRNAKSFEQMSEIGTVVLVEKAEQTQYKNLEKELTLCAQQGARVFGVIGLE